MSSIEYGPSREDTMLVSRGLDYYKPTMSQLAYEKEPQATVTFTFKNRGEQRLEDYISVDGLQGRLDTIREYDWQPDEIDYFATLVNSTGDRVFSDAFLGHLQQEGLPPARVTHDEATGDLAITATGKSSEVTFWETIVMSEANEMYFENYVRANGLDLAAIYEEGDRRLDEKVASMQANPDIKIADFGTRRHFSFRWQRHVLQRLQTECPDNLLGTSNVALANTMGLKPIGTFAHEMPMLYAGLADARGEDIRDSHNTFLQDWHERYGDDLAIALTDTFGSDFFFEDFTPKQARQWRGVRHDSGDPVAFGERLIDFYDSNGIDAETKTVVFSDGLDMQQIVDLNNHFKGRINIIFGWGTTLTNDLGLQPLNVVMKVTHVKTAEGQEADTVKLSDNAGKHTGPAEKVKEYQHVFQRITAAV
ncbi:MAG TPA: nicotinate phosphoribosyltransferase [Verrucomicrobiae bacterium]|jgi:nicotinate phosphoribosyltransferase|nr:nicotinate phosphoribosyltransferase [Verrucomicrobiae bacterium]